MRSNTAASSPICRWPQRRRHFSMVLSSRSHQRHTNASASVAVAVLPPAALCWLAPPAAPPILVKISASSFLPGEQKGRSVRRSLSAPELLAVTRARRRRASKPRTAPTLQQKCRQHACHLVDRNLLGDKAYLTGPLKKVLKSSLWNKPFLLKFRRRARLVARRRRAPSDNNNSGADSERFTVRSFCSPGRILNALIFSEMGGAAVSANQQSCADGGMVYSTASLRRRLVYLALCGKICQRNKNRKSYFIIFIFYIYIKILERKGNFCFENDKLFFAVAVDRSIKICY